MQFRFRRDCNLAVIDSGRRLAAQRDSVIADNVDAHGWVLLIDPAAAAVGAHGRPPAGEPMPAVFELAPGEPRGFRMGSGAPQATIDCADYEMSTPPSGRSYVLSNQPVQELLHLSHCCRMWASVAVWRAPAAR